MVATVDSDDFGAKVQLDTTVGEDAGREVARHRDSQIVGAHDEPDPRPATREKQGRLPGGVGTADHGHLRAVNPARTDFKLGCRVVDAVALEVRPSLEVQFPVVGAARDHDRAGRDLAPSDRVTTRSSAIRSDVTSHGLFISAPNFWACTSALAVSSAPAIPDGKPRKFSIRALAPACPPAATPSSSSVSRASEAP